MVFERLSALQPKLAAELEGLSSRSEIPRSVLFQGRRGTGRLTAALDLASSFFASGVIDPSSVLFFASRPFHSELKAAENLLLRQRNRKSRDFYLSTVHRILLQYHSVLNENHKDPDGVKGIKRKATGKGEEKEKDLFERASRIDELLMELEEPGWEERAESVVGMLSKRLDDQFLSFGRKTANASIDDIRKAQSWLSTGLEEKCVIFENVEDYTESAKNSLLKLLEEPHPHAHLILISAHPGRLLETILSRVRKFSFPEIPQDRLNAFLRDTFFMSKHCLSFEDFFFKAGSDEGDGEEMQSFVKLYYKALRTGKGLKMEEEESLFSYLEKIKGFDQFIEYVLAALEEDFCNGGIPSGKARAVYDLLYTLAERKDTYNMSARYALDLALREAEDVC